MQKTMRGGLVWAGALCLLMTAIAGAADPARGDDSGISVVGTGTAKARPTQVEIECTLSGEAELAADATVKFRDAKKRAVAAINGMKNADLAVKSDGVSVGNVMDPNAQMMMQRGQPVTSVKPRVQVVEKERIVIANADKMDADALLDLVLKVLDVAKDAGFQMPQMQQESYYQRGYQQVRMTGNAVSFKLPASSLAYWNPDTHAWTVEADQVDLQVGASSGDIRLHKTVAVDIGR